MEGAHDPAVPGPRPPAGAEALDSPFHSKPGAEKSVPRRNPMVTFGVIGGLLAILALAIAMLFSSPDYVETEGEVPETMQVEARR